MTGLDLEPLGREIVHPVTGEVFDLATESMENLAERVVDLQAHRERIGDFDRTLNDALLAHLDRSLKWTQRVGDPAGERQFELKAPSPAAGVESYPTDALRDALALFVDTGVISQAAASEALLRRLVVELDIPWGEDPQAMADAVKNAAEIHVAGVKVNVVRAEPSSKVSAAGVKALRKIPGTDGALDDALVRQDSPRRRVKVTVRTKDRP